MKNVVLIFLLVSLFYSIILFFRLKQVEESKARIANDLHEMDKPMARSKDDEDLDAHLKAVERTEDPMLQFMRKKQKKKQAASGLPRKLSLLTIVTRFKVFYKLCANFATR